MEKKEYISPEIEIIKFEKADVITASEPEPTNDRLISELPINLK